MPTNSVPQPDGPSCTSPPSLIISHLPSVDELFKNLVALPPLSHTLTACLPAACLSGFLKWSTNVGQALFGKFFDHSLSYPNFAAAQRDIRAVLVL